METFALPLHWRRGFPWRMSLRTLMLIVLVAGAGLGWFALEILQIDGPQVTDLWLDRLAAIKSLKEVQIGGAQVSDEAIARLHRSSSQVQIYVDGRPR